MIPPPKNEYGHLCGIDPAVKDKPYLYYFDLMKCFNLNALTNGCPERRICIEKCPTKEFYYSKYACEELGKYQYFKNNIICIRDFTEYWRHCYDITAAIYRHNQCGQWYLPSIPCKFRIVQLL